MIKRNLAIFTICSNNYVAMARVLIASALNHHPSARMFLVVADDIIDEDGFYPEECTLVKASDLAIPHFASFAFRYDVMEFNTAVKPFMFQYLMKGGFEAILYFDPDIEVFRYLDTVLDPIERGASFVLTPHLCQPSDNNAFPDDIGIMQAGIYNLGFLGVGSSQEAADIIAWWARRLEYQCISAQERGIFVDQKFMDLVPGFADDVHITRDTTLNVAYWNLPQRDLAEDNGTWTVDGRQLGFFHFSGFDPYKLDVLSKYTLGYRGESLSHDLRRLSSHYADQLKENDYGKFPSPSYAYGRFASGTAISPLVRKIFREDHPIWAGNPFETFERYLNSLTTERWAGPDGGLVTNLMAALRTREPWLREHMDPNIPGSARNYVDWWLKHARPIVGDDRFIDVVANRLGQRTKPQRTAPHKHRADNPDVDVVGYLRLALGLGQAGRQTLQSLAGTSLTVKGLEVSLNSNSTASEAVSDALLAQRGEAPIQVFCINADQIEQVIHHLGDRIRPDAYRILTPFWELSDFPDAWLSAFDLVDEIWAPTQFIQTTLLRKTTKPVIHMPLALDFSPPPAARRSRYNLPKDKFLFFFAFDFFSFLQRKNPMAILQAFKLAFRGRHGAAPAALVLKTLNAKHVPDKSQTLIDLFAEDPDVTIIDQTLSREDTLSLIGACDAVVSLHRSEGLGLLIAEAMVLKKPVISTDFSATTELVNPETGFPVGYRLVPVEDGHYPFHEGQFWADADIDHAAWQMRAVYNNNHVVRAKVENARHHIRLNYGCDTVSRKQAERIRLIMG